ncbi:hypothetical protein GCM10010384_31580 [Streptomyces djakartensis]|uniref:Uncharacterized protein n=2 Tax=Streptomyces djakartensis TaxID=68193 RepID=A0ABQ2ZQC3_9ACTN|nr:hypothetical protein GCM10010384_31580 [Streptomyces djakartensis]
MSSDYASMMASAMVALLVIGAVEVANAMHFITSVDDRVRAMYASEFTEATQALRDGAQPLPPERRVALLQAVTDWHQFRDRMAFYGFAIYALWLTTTALDLTTLGAVLNWAAQKNGADEPGLARFCILSCGVSVLLVVMLFLSRMMAGSYLSKMENHRKRIRDGGIADEEYYRIVSRFREKFQSDPEEL